MFLEESQATLYHTSRDNVSEMLAKSLLFFCPINE